MIAHDSFYQEKHEKRSVKWHGTVVVKTQYVLILCRNLSYYGV